MQNDRIKLLDCTLRDGGQGLEAAVKEGVSEVRFNNEVIDRTITHLVRSDVDIV